MHENEISKVFDRWNNGVLDSFLIEISRDILKYNDEDGTPLVTKIMDSAGQKVPIWLFTAYSREQASGLRSTRLISVNL